MGILGSVRNQPPALATRPESWRLEQLDSIRHKAGELLDKAEWGAKSPNVRSATYLSDHFDRTKRTTDRTIVEIIQDGDDLMVGFTRLDMSSHGELSPRLERPTLLMDFLTDGREGAVDLHPLSDEDLESSLWALSDPMNHEHLPASMDDTYELRMELHARMWEVLRSEKLPETSPSYPTATTHPAQWAANIVLGS